MSANESNPPSLSSLVGRVVEADYPRHNYRGVLCRTERRRFRVDRVRDLAAEPLDTVTVSLDPLLNRGSVLLCGWDYDRQGERSFYWERLANIRIIEDAEPTEPEPTAQAESPRLGNVIILDKPADWAPVSTNDIPPDVETHALPSQDLAKVFANRFNEREMESPRGSWCLCVSPCVSQNGKLNKAA